MGLWLSCYFISNIFRHIFVNNCLLLFLFFILYFQCQFNIKFVKGKYKYIQLIRFHQNLNQHEQSAKSDHLLLYAPWVGQQKKYGAYLMIFDDNSKIISVKSS